MVSAQGLHADAGAALPADAMGRIPAVAPGSLGAASFREAHGVRGNLVAGAMAGGIASADLVVAMSRAGLLGFFGAGGLGLDAVEEALKQITAALTPGAAWGANLLHNPVEPAVEERTVDLYLRLRRLPDLRERLHGPDARGGPLPHPRHPRGGRAGDHPQPGLRQGQPPRGR